MEKTKTKRLRIATAAIAATSLCLFALAACDVGGSGGDDAGSVDGEIYAVYQQYVEYAQANNNPMLDYEQWLATIKGEDGKDGVTPTISINDDGYWVINGEVSDVNASGKDGKNGSSWNAGYGLPVNSSGANGDLYINLEDYEIYVKANGAWTKMKNEVQKLQYTEGLAYQAVKDEGEIVGYEVRGLGIADDIDIVIPSEYKGKPVIGIQELALQQCKNLTSVVIPDNVTSIGRAAFNGCSSLTSVKIGNSVTSIGPRAFMSCSSLTSITIPNSVTIIDDGVFSSCSSLTNIIYKGTIEEWKGISKSYIGDNITPDYTVTCTNGVLSREESIE